MARRVQRPEEQRLQDPALEPAAPRHAIVECPGKEPAVVVQPSTLLQEGEEEQTRDVEQRDIATAV